MRVAAIALVAAGLAAQTGAPPVIRSTTRLVQVSVLVHDKNGPVTGLTSGDFTLFDDRKERRIELFSEDSPKTPAPRAAAPAHPGLFTNALDSGSEAHSSVTVVLLDGLNTPIRDQMYARRQLTKFLAQIEPDDRVALYSLGRSLTILHDFTNDRQELARLIAAFRGRIDNAPEPVEAASAGGGSQPTAALAKLNQALEDMEHTIADFDAAANARFTADALSAIANHIAPLPGRKNLVWISASFNLTLGMDDLTIAGSRPAQNFTEHVQRAAAALNAANVAVYPIDARGLMVLPTFSPDTSGLPRSMPGMPPMRTIRSARDTMQLLAANTGGTAFYDTNDLAGSVRRAIDDAKAAYTLGFYVDDADLDGKYRELKVRLRGGRSAELRHRKGYVALDSSQLQTSQKFLLDAALRSPLQASAIRLTVRLAPAAPGVFRVSLNIALREVSLTPGGGRWHGAFGIRVAQLDRHANVLEMTSDTVTLNLREENYSQYAQSGMPISRNVVLRPDLDQLRIIVLDSNTGAFGSLIIPASHIAR